jgi:hypothetical protein
MNRNRRKVEVSEADFEQFVKSYPQPLKFDGRSYTERVAQPHMVWEKPIAVKEGGKFYLVKD